ncbi:LOW QUALITY PROTEIN: small EDRK-rich factor 2-like [Oncorhynchus tshawytscha]|nr:LOW QUALITY PROTEIN: small EDRK-rich factor 2 [Oncorhynchus mykiss]XP_024235291.1 LOW QUALITY PROTEIN: small EDRK-rich factor 2-like [Oncorhynchus tshawytscha]
MSRINAFNCRDEHQILSVHSCQAWLWHPSPHGQLQTINKMTRGNQRDLARAKNAKKQGNDKGKKADDGMSAAARKLRDAEIMQQKQKKASDPKPSDEKAK